MALRRRKELPESVKVVIPVAGVGVRLRPHTHTIPKALITVAGQPILGHILDAVLPLAPEEVVLVIGYMGDRVVEYMKREHPAVPVRFAVQEEAKGLGHAIWTARASLVAGEPVLIVLGDTVFEVDLAPVVGGGVSALGVMEVEDPRRFGVVQVEGGLVRRVVEKPDSPVSRLAITGVYYFADAGRLASALDDVVERGIKTKGEFQLTDALQLLLERGERIATFPLAGWFDCGKRETLLETNRYLLDRRGDGVRIDGSVVVGPVAIAPSAKIERSIIGPHVSVAPGAEIRDSVVRNSIVNRNAVVERSLLDASLVGENAAVRGAFQKLNVGDDSEIAHDS